MSKWRSKILLGLIMYFGGFASAIYALAPGVERSGTKDYVPSREVCRNESGTKSEEFAQAFNVVMRKCVSFAEDKSVEINELVQAKLSERRRDSEN